MPPRSRAASSVTAAVGNLTSASASFSCLSETAFEANEVLEVGTAFEAGVQIVYLLLLVFVVGGIFYIGLQQQLVRRKLDIASKELQEKVRTGEATAEEFYTYGAIMIEKEYYSLAIKALKESIEKWEGKDDEQAQIHNALGFALQKLDKCDDALVSFKAAVNLCPEYVVAHRNLGDSYERLKKFKEALESYEEALRIDPNDKTSREKVEYVRRIAERRGEV